MSSEIQIQSQKTGRYRRIMSQIPIDSKCLGDLLHAGQAWYHPPFLIGIITLSLKIIDSLSGRNRRVISQMQTDYNKLGDLLYAKQAKYHRASSLSCSRVRESGPASALVATVNKYNYTESASSRVSSCSSTEQLLLAIFSWFSLINFNTTFFFKYWLAITQLPAISTRNDPICTHRLLCHRKSCYKACCHD